VFTTRPLAGIDHRNLARRSTAHIEETASGILGHRDRAPSDADLRGLLKARRRVEEHHVPPGGEHRQPEPIFRQQDSGRVGTETQGDPPDRLLPRHVENGEFVSPADDGVESLAEGVPLQVARLAAQGQCANHAAIHAFEHRDDSFTFFGYVHPSTQWRLGDLLQLEDRGPARCGRQLPIWRPAKVQDERAPLVDPLVDGDRGGPLDRDADPGFVDLDLDTGPGELQGVHLSGRDLEARPTGGATAETVRLQGAELDLRRVMRCTGVEGRREEFEPGAGLGARRDSQIDEHEGLRPGVERHRGSWNHEGQGQCGQDPHPLTAQERPPRQRARAK
jgi:hypothetical protein